MTTTKPTPAIQKATMHAATAPQTTPPQLAPATQPITAAQRQWAYRQRSKRAVTQAIGDEASASRVTLLTLLGQTLASLDDRTAKSKHSACRNSARRVISNLVTRYEIDLNGSDRT